MGSALGCQWCGGSAAEGRPIVIRRPLRLCRICVEEPGIERAQSRLAWLAASRARPDGGRTEESGEEKRA